MSSVRSRISAEKNELFPLFLKLTGQRCLVVGAGKTMEQKIPTLFSCGSRIIVVAPTATPQIQRWAQAKKLTWIQRRFDAHDLDDIFLCIVSTSSKATNQSIYEQAQRRRILCNVVREGAHCNFYYPAVVKRGPLQIAISTAGHSGALAKRLREELEKEFGPEWEDWLRWLGQARASLYDDPLSPRHRRTMLHKLASRKTQDEMFRRWGVAAKR